jgi:hypothetical protein
MELYYQCYKEDSALWRLVGEYDVWYMVTHLIMYHTGSHIWRSLSTIIHVVKS